MILIRYVEGDWVKGLKVMYFFKFPEVVIPQNGIVRVLTYSKICIQKDIVILTKTLSEY